MIPAGLRVTPEGGLREAVEDLHGKVPMHPHEDDCRLPDDHRDEWDFDGEFCPVCPVDWFSCATCRSEDGEFIEWPCETAALLAAHEPAPTPPTDVPNIFTLGHEGRMFLLSWLQVEVLKGTPIDADTWRGAWGQAADYQTIVNARRALDGAVAS